MATPNAKSADTSHVLDEKKGYDVEILREDTRLSRASAKDVLMKRRIRIMRVVQRSANLIMSVIVLGIMLNTYITFRNHRTQVVNGQPVPIYPTDPITWPTFMMIATASVSLLFNAGIVMAYFRGVVAANKVSMYSGYWGYLVFALNTVVWLVTTTTFKMVQGDAGEIPPPRDLWGWTCSDAVDALSQQFQTAVNFDLQCTTQTVSFAMGIINAGVEMFGFVISGFALLRLLNKKKLERLQQANGN